MNWEQFSKSSASMNRRRQQARLTKFENGLKGRSGEILLKLQNWQNLNGVSAKKTNTRSLVFWVYLFLSVACEGPPKLYQQREKSSQIYHLQVCLVLALAWKAPKITSVTCGKAPQMCHLHVGMCAICHVKDMSLACESMSRWRDVLRWAVLLPALVSTGQH